MRVGETLRRRVLWVEDRPLALSLTALAIAAGVSAAMASAAGFDAVGRVLEGSAPEWLALILAGRLASYAGYAAAHRFTLGEHARVPTEVTLKTVMFGAAATSLRGGFRTDQRVMLAAGCSSREATLKVLNLGALELATLAPVACVCAFALLGAPEVDDSVATSWAIGVPVGVALAALALWRVQPAALARRGRLGRAAARSLEALALLVEQIRSPSSAAPALGGMALYWAGEIVSLWAALRAFGVHAGVAVTVLAYATGHVLTPRSLPLSGVGVTEALLPLALVWVGIPLAHAVVAVVVYRMALLSLSIPPALVSSARVRALVRLRA